MVMTFEELAKQRAEEFVQVLHTIELPFGGPEMAETYSQMVKSLKAAYLTGYLAGAIDSKGEKQ